MKNKALQDPQVMLETAIETIDLFTKSDASRLEVGTDGRLVASQQSHIDRLKTIIGPLFSEKSRKEQSQQLEGVKQAVLGARDTIQSHSALLDKFRQGSDAERRFAEYALSAIERYNTVISKEESAKHVVYNYQREQLLEDKSISKLPIELPHTLTVKFHSHPVDHSVDKLFKAMGRTAHSVTTDQSTPLHSPTHKKTLQFMIDTFHLKAIRLIQTHLSQQSSMGDIVPLVKNTPLEIDESTNPELIAMQQLLEMGPGFFILVSGCFKKNSSDSKFLTLPMMDTFRLSFQLTHNGFPFPSERAGSSLGIEWIEASPLRSEQTPHFQKVEQRRKEMAHRLVYDQDFIQKAHRYAKLKREIFDQNRDLFLKYYEDFQLSLRQNPSKEEREIIRAFGKELKDSPSSFDLLVNMEQQIYIHFVKQPLKALQEEWLDAQSTLRKGTPQERFKNVCSRLSHHRSEAAKNLDHSFLISQGTLLGHAFQAIALQYLSEKMGFSPPLLSDFERKLQFFAFHQMLSFLDQSDLTDPDHIKEQMEATWEKDLAIIRSSSIEEEEVLSLSLVNELEFYFNSRFSSFRNALAG